MISDVYVEQLVEKRSCTADTLKKIGIVLGAVILSVLAFWFMYAIGLLLAAAIFYGGYYLLTGIDCEYEYIFTNGDLDIDKIKGKRSRNRLVTAQCENFTSFGRLVDAPEAASGVTTVLAAGGDEEQYYADFKHSSAGDVRLIFTPDERILEAVTAALPRQVKAEYKRSCDKIRLSE